MKNKFKDFECYCGCGQQIRIQHLKMGLLDIGYTTKHKRPIEGIVLKGKELEKFIKYISKAIKKT